MLTQPLADCIVPAHGTAVPALAHGDAQNILLFQKGRDVILLHLQAFVVGRPARRKDKIAHALAVEMRLIHAHGGHAQHSLFGAAVQGKGAGKIGRGIARITGGTDPAGNGKHGRFLLMKLCVLLFPLYQISVRRKSPVLQKIHRVL